MDTKDNATPRPWKIQRFELRYNSGDRNGVRVVSAETDETITDNETYYPHGITDANAKLIVQAVNAHDALVEACKLAIRLIDSEDTSKTHRGLAGRKIITQALALAGVKS